MRGQDLLTALADELHGIAPELVQAYDAGSTAEPGDAARADDAYVTSVARLSEAAGYVGLEGVQRIATCVLANLEHLGSGDLRHSHSERCRKRAFDLYLRSRGKL